jgi:hypothetical protein
MLYGDRSPDATVLWAWNGRAWRSFDAPGPGLRRHIKLAYDVVRDRLVLYGGMDDSGTQTFADTWEWDGQRWAQFTSPGPGPRSSYSLVYDPNRRSVVLFGGLSPEGPEGDTWAWNGQAWTNLAADGPSPRGEAALAFDSQSKRLVLAGGMAYGPVVLSSGRTGWRLLRDRMPRDTWALDGSRWRQLAESGLARMGPMAVDPLTGNLLRIGGESSDGTYHGDFWRWIGSEWHMVPDAAIPARHGPGISLDTGRRRLVIFGGAPQEGGALADLWEWDGRRIYQVTAHEP